MTSDDSKNPDAGAAFAAAWTGDGEDREAKLIEATENLRLEMEALSKRVADLILNQPPLDLLGYLWSRFFLDVSMSAHARSTDEPDKALIQKNQLAMEYVHAVLSGLPAPTTFRSELQAEDVDALFETLDELSAKTMMYVMASSMVSTSTEFGASSRDVEFQAKSTWMLIRGHRYQVLEEEFFLFVLAPHEDALIRAYGMSAAEIATGVQAIVNSMTSGLWTAADKIQKQMDACHDLMEAEKITMDEAIARLRGENPDWDSEAGGAIQDMFFGGMTNLSRHTKLTPPLLDDLSYERGENTEFFEEGPLRGTPMRTLPARIKPLVKLNGDAYAPDGQFVRDSAYRALQRGLLAREPGYREVWKERQTKLVEEALPTILSKQFSGARTFRSVYYKDVHSGQWAETDLVIEIEDVLIVAEAKSGVGAMGSPATNFERHARAVRELVTKAYDQCERFLKYMASRPEVSIFALLDGKYVEVGRLRLSQYRVVFPLGLTVESFTPFSAMCKELPGITPILGKHPFVSMSVDDLFVLNRFLPTAGEFFHYLEVRQQVAGIPRAHLFDELDHLGAYVTKNRFDQIIREQLEEADMVAWDSFSDTVDRYFEQDRWRHDPPPSQEFPVEVRSVLSALDACSSPLRFRLDSQLRNLGGEGRNNIARILRELAPTLRMHPRRRALFDGEQVLQLWLCREGMAPSAPEIIRHGEIACLVSKQQQISVLLLGADASGEFKSADAMVVSAPPIVRTDYFELVAEAQKQAAKAVTASKGSPSKSKPRKSKKRGQR